MIRFVARTYPPCWASPFSFTISVLGSFMCITQHTGPTSLRPIRRTKQLWLKCLAQGHKRRDRPGRDSNPHSGNTRTWVQFTRPLGHNTPTFWLIWIQDVCMMYCDQYEARTRCDLPSRWKVPFLVESCLKSFFFFCRKLRQRERNHGSTWKPRERVLGKRRQQSLEDDG